MNPKIQKILTSLDRAYSGPVCTVKDWDSKIIPRTTKAVLARHGLQKMCNPAEPINTDDDVADAFFKAGYELALEIGMLCPDTERIIKAEEKEIQQTLKETPDQLTLGTDAELVVMKPRRPEDPYPPLVAVSLGIVVSEELWVPIVTGMIQKKHLVDALHGPSLQTVYGHEVRSGTPYETLMGRYEAQLRTEATFRAGRPGLAQTGIAGATTEYGHLGGMPALAGPGNITMSLCPVELKVTFANFHRIVQGLNYGNRLRVGGYSFIGGYAGSPEGALLLNIATDLLIPTLLATDYCSSYVYDVRFFGNCGRDAVWANSVAIQAVSRNTRFMRNKIVNETAGPCTEMFLYEAAVGLMNHCVSGASKTTQPRSAGGKYKDYLTPLEAWWCGEVFKSCAGMTRKQANEIAKCLIPKYEAQLAAPPKGKPVQECFDLQAMEPSPEYAAIYEKVKHELIDLGMPLRW